MTVVKTNSNTYLHKTAKTYSNTKPTNTQLNFMLNATFIIIGCFTLQKRPPRNFNSRFSFPIALDGSVDLKPE